MIVATAILIASSSMMLLTSCESSSSSSETTITSEADAEQEVIDRYVENCAHLFYEIHSYKNRNTILAISVEKATTYDYEKYNTPHKVEYIIHIYGAVYYCTFLCYDDICYVYAEITLSDVSQYAHQ